MYKNIVAEPVRGEKNTHTIHLWTDSGYSQTKWVNPAYKECHEADATHIGLNGQPLRKTTKYYYNPYGPDSENEKGIHFADMKAHQKFLIEKYGTNDEPSTTHSEVFFDIETEMLDSLSEEGIREAPKMVTSIAWYDKQADQWGILILDTKNQLKHTKAKNKEIIPVQHESDLLYKWVDKLKEIQPDILIGYNSDYFDIPYLYYRICKVLGKDIADEMSPIGKVTSSLTRHNNNIRGKNFQEIDLKGISSLDYMRMHKKYSWADEPSWKLDAIGEKYTGIGKVEYEGNLDQLFETDIHKFIQYNFRDVEILKLLDEKLQYLALTKNLSHKGKHNYSEVYSNSITQDGAISAYLLSQGIVPPARHRNPKAKKGYAGGYLFCPQAGLYKYMFDEDLTSLYPSIIMSLNIGRETFKGRIIDADDRNNRLGLNDLKERDPEEELLVENDKKQQTRVNVGRLIAMIEQNNLAISANGCLFSTDKESTLSTVLNKWFDERVKYKNEMKKAYKSGDKEKGAYYHLMQYTMKILLNSLYGATALPGFRYGLPESILSESITLTGWRIIQESALCANRHMNKVIKNEVKLNI